jgi:Protein of unknown function (DUF2939)
MLRKFVVLVCIALSLGVGYAVSPIWMAMDLKRAVRQGDLETLETRVDWPSVRASLKASLAELERAREAESTARGLPRPSLWQRIKAAAAPARYADTLVERYVTPDNVVRLAAAKGSFRAVLARVDRAVSSQVAPTLLAPDQLASGQAVAEEDGIADDTRPLVERAQRFWARLHRVQFLNLTTIELEVQDRRVAERRYISTLELKNLGWRVSSVRVVGVGF